MAASIGTRHLSPAWRASDHILWTPSFAGPALCRQSHMQTHALMPPPVVSLVVLAHQQTLVAAARMQGTKPANTRWRCAAS
ncbi:hypothetical protein CGRA01v4_05423 [Colletotrichum graminicola]|nr:hypothetical protein CGRA01v4_05423 [Colletotrichum graminicola]